MLQAGRGFGTSEGLRLLNNFHRICKVKYGVYYVLKCDISQFFASIDHEILKKKVKRRIKEKDSLKIVYDIIDSENPGLGIGSMTSQILAIFYLNDMDHYIKEELKIKYYVRYQDDFILLHESKDYLKMCLEKIKEFLTKEKLTLNRKTRIYKSTNNFIFLGRNKKGKYARYRQLKRKIKRKLKDYNQGEVNLSSLASTVIAYKMNNNKKIVKKNKK